MTKQLLTAALGALLALSIAWSASMLHGISNTLTRFSELQAPQEVSILMPSTITVKKTDNSGAEYSYTVTQTAGESHANFLIRARKEIEAFCKEFDL